MAQEHRHVVLLRRFIPLRSSLSFLPLDFSDEFEHKHSVLRRMLGNSLAVELATLTRAA
jgi:hypothetical protein